MKKENKFSTLESVVLPIIITIVVNVAQLALRALDFLNAIMPNVFYIVAISSLSCLVVVLISWTKTINEIVYDWIYRILIICKYCALILFCLTTIFIFGIISEKKEILFYQKLDVSFFLALIAIIIPISIWKKTDNMDQNPIRVHDLITSEYSTTGTCIPFSYDTQSKKIKTYLIFNEAYDAEKWMFPGGHAFSSDEAFPSSIAIQKANEEAGLDVEIIDLYHSYDISTVTNQDCADYFSVLNPPHFTYLFKLSPNVRCYNKRGHRYHYDVVYVAEIKSVLSQTAKFERLSIELPVDELTIQQLHQILTTEIDEYARSKDRKDYSKYFAFGGYVEKMLLEAHRDYVTFLNKKEAK